MSYKILIETIAESPYQDSGASRGTNAIAVSSIIVEFETFAEANKAFHILSDLGNITNNSVRKATKLF